jgi:D-beta-D-heptose 7-phosphate kinase/D-beta-D-heptose 1-phosphate adenosyltransferase
MNELNSLLSKIKTLKEFLKFKGEFLQDKRIVFTNGCFDILHRGHVEYLCRAKSLGDILVVGLNSDKSIKKIKGDKRPINNETDRAIVLSAIQFVDFVIIFEEENPYNLIKEIRPHVLVKGGDWEKEKVVGYNIVKQNKGEVHTSFFLPNYSTTGIIETIIKRYCNNSCPAPLGGQDKPRR